MQMPIIVHFSVLYDNSADKLRHPRIIITRIIIIILIIIITTMIFIVLSCTAPAICESSLWIIWAKVGQGLVATNS